MNLKAEKFKAYIAENNITNFKVEENINNLDDGVEYNIEDVIKAFTNREFPESENVDDEKFGSTLNHLFGLAELENESDNEESEEDGEGEK